MIPKAKTFCGPNLSIKIPKPKVTTPQMIALKPIAKEKYSYPSFMNWLIGSKNMPKDWRTPIIIIIINEQTKIINCQSTFFDNILCPHKFTNFTLSKIKIIFYPLPL